MTPDAGHVHGERVLRLNPQGFARFNALAAAPWRSSRSIVIGLRYLITVRYDDLRTGL
jgi:hypothetical protein